MTQDERQPQKNIDSKNAAFWDNLCGSQLAQQLGIEDDSAQSLKKFDDWYFGYYPYLYTHIPFAKMKDKRVLEVGLGYGTVSQKIAESGADYNGLDIAAGPVGMVNQRMGRGGLNGKAVQGSILEPPFDAASFDWVVAIGCLHHTGDLTGAIKQVHRLLKTGGEAMIMVYNACSYRQLQNSPITTLKRLYAKPETIADIADTSGDSKSRGAYDTNDEGDAAPQTEFVSTMELQAMCSDFSQCSIVAENIGEESLFKKMSRQRALKFGKAVGLDLYCHVVK
ncbi:MAG: class I SAM-dependent methyltransferase [Hyphomicrobiaceae bacterium]|nr:class I SAM-dependent methyltransferase [Hyphomicrobiaceae bacterium]